MNSLKKVLCVAASVLMIAVLMCSCGGKSAESGNNTSSEAASAVSKLSKVIDSDSFQKQIKDLNKQLKDTVKIKAFAEGNTIVYQYTYVNQLTEKEVKERQDAIDEEQLKTGAKTVLETFVKSFDEPDLGVSYRYYNKDGSLIHKSDFGRDILD